MAVWHDLVFGVGVQSKSHSCIILPEYMTGKHYTTTHSLTTALHHGPVSTTTPKDPPRRDNRRIHTRSPTVRNRQSSDIARPHHRIRNTRGPGELGTGKGRIWFHYQSISPRPRPNRQTTRSALPPFTSMGYLQRTRGVNGVQVHV